MKGFRGAIITSAEAINKAAKIVGSEKALAAKIGVNRQNLNYWKFNTLLPYDKAAAIYVITDGMVGIDELRPDQQRLTKKLEKMILKKFKQQ